MLKDSKVVNISRESKDRESYDPKTNDKMSTIRTENTMTQRQMTKSQTIVHNAQRRKLKIEEHGPTKNGNQLRCSGRVSIVLLNKLCRVVY